jgi:hypothetical protein
MPFQAGNNANPKGRPVGSRNRRTQEILDLISQRGDKDPLDFLSEVISSQNHYPVEQKISASNILAPYLHSKYGAKIPPRYITEPVVLPHPQPTSIDQANANINYISARKANGAIDLDFADSLIADNKVIANNLIAEEELKLKIAASPGGSDGTINIAIQGGLPELPGTSVIMPHNGHAIEGHLINGQGTELPSPNSQECNSECNSILPDAAGSATTTRTSCETPAADGAASSQDGEP